jgi:hypothetical protein
VLSKNGHGALGSNWIASAFGQSSAKFYLGCEVAGVEIVL